MPVAGNATEFAAAYCDAGEVATGGGYDVSPHGANVSVTFSGPGDANADGRADAWGTNAHNNTTEQVSLQAYAVCSPAAAAS